MVGSHDIKQNWLSLKNQLGKFTLLVGLGIAGLILWPHSPPDAEQVSSEVLNDLFSGRAVPYQLLADSDRQLITEPQFASLIAEVIAPLMKGSSVLNRKESSSAAQAGTRLTWRDKSGLIRISELRADRTPQGGKVSLMGLLSVAWSPTKNDIADSVNPGAGIAALIQGYQGSAKALERIGVAGLPSSKTGDLVTWAALVERWGRMEMGMRNTPTDESLEGLLPFTSERPCLDPYKD